MSASLQKILAKSRVFAMAPPLLYPLSVNEYGGTENERNH
jgi:hypothetical protein